MRALETYELLEKTIYYLEKDVIAGNRNVEQVIEENTYYSFVYVNEIFKEIFSITIKQYVRWRKVSDGVKEVSSISKLHARDTVNDIKHYKEKLLKYELEEKNIYLRNALYSNEIKVLVEEKVGNICYDKKILAINDEQIMVMNKNNDTFLDLNCCSLRYKEWIFTFSGTYHVSEVLRRPEIIGLLGVNGYLRPPIKCDVYDAFLQVKRYMENRVMQVGINYGLHVNAENMESGRHIIANMICGSTIHENGEIEMNINPALYMDKQCLMIDLERIINMQNQS